MKDAWLEYTLLGFGATLLGPGVSIAAIATTPIGFGTKGLIIGGSALIVLAAAIAAVRNGREKQRRHQVDLSIWEERTAGAKTPDVLVLRATNQSTSSIKVVGMWLDDGLGGEKIGVVTVEMPKTLKPCESMEGARMKAAAPKLLEWVGSGRAELEDGRILKSTREENPRPVISTRLLIDHARRKELETPRPVVKGLIGCEKPGQQ